ncbi:hypothetical protein KUCAC02_002465 [Chaenocephalus aceratus]|uniref:Uncharacterized protein n=1 Tax=Chaenocephalus aceratus TaxID=36190 RepID=A0ACB9XTN7_CHAAC|nr:hypothetical protein KUCAC02_002465 [Chaenocephalus aceratus]
MCIDDCTFQTSEPLLSPLLLSSPAVEVEVCLVEYTHSSRLTMTQLMVESPLKAAADLLTCCSLELKRTVRAFLARLLHVDNCPGMLAFSQLQKCFTLEKEACRLLLGRSEISSLYSFSLELRQSGGNASMTVVGNNIDVAGGHSASRATAATTRSRVTHWTSEVSKPLAPMKRMCLVSLKSSLYLVGGPDHPP